MPDHGSRYEDFVYSPALELTGQRLILSSSRYTHKANGIGREVMTRRQFNRVLRTLQMNVWPVKPLTFEYVLKANFWFVD